MEEVFENIYEHTIRYLGQICPAIFYSEATYLEV